MAFKKAVALESSVALVKENAYQKSWMSIWSLGDIRNMQQLLIK